MAGLVRGLPSFLTIVTYYVSRPKNLEDLYQSEIAKTYASRFLRKTTERSTLDRIRKGSMTYSVVVLPSLPTINTCAISF